ncbi:MAG: phosphonoacetaldehyde reductase [Rhizobiaceae bacterium]|nr:phosphonoacetaldehyde reductase [Rhizobiaceae bacterium]
MWAYFNPVKVKFGVDAFHRLSDQIAGRAYGLVTYPDAPFRILSDALVEEAGAPVAVISDVAPNPDFKLLKDQCATFDSNNGRPEVIVALGGGSVIDSAKVFASADGDFSRVQRFLETGKGDDELGNIPVIAVPTTAGTGSEVTCWATVWDEDNARKYSLARASLYPEAAIIDPRLMVGKPIGLTVSTGLDALSHALESIWNINANPVSACCAVKAARTLLQDLPRLLRDPVNLDLRSNVAEASLFAGLAFSNTKTAIAHNLSYPVTLGWGVQHGIACSFTLPAILRSMAGCGGFREASLAEIFGDDLEAGSERLKSFLAGLGVGHRFADHGVPDSAFLNIVDEAFAGERGKNFAGSKERFLEAAAWFEIASPSAA